MVGARNRCVTRVGFGELQRAGRGERPVQHVGRPGEPRGQEQVPGGVRDRRRVPDHRRPAEVGQPVVPVAAVHEPVVLGVPDALRPPGGARRVPDDVPVVRGDRDERVLGRLGRHPFLVPGVAHEHRAQRRDLAVEPLHRVGVRLLGHHQRRTGLLHHHRVRLPRAAGVQRHPDGARDRRAQEQVGRPERVVLNRRHAVAGPEPGRQQTVRDPDPALPRLAEGQRPGARHQRGSVGVKPHGLAHQARNVHDGLPSHVDIQTTV